MECPVFGKIAEQCQPYSRTYSRPDVARSLRRQFHSSPIRQKSETRLKRWRPALPAPREFAGAIDCKNCELPRANIRLARDLESQAERDLCRIPCRCCGDSQDCAETIRLQSTVEARAQLASRSGRRAG